MTRSLSSAKPAPASKWQMPILPDSYDQRPFSPEECQAIEHMKNVSSYAHGVFNPSSRESRAAKSMLTRLSQPFTDIFHLRYQGRMEARCTGVHLMMYREMARHGKIFWSWSPDEWMDTLCPKATVFATRYGLGESGRNIIMDAAYLLASISDLRLVGHEWFIVEAANTYFGTELITQQCKKVVDALSGKGYQESPANVHLWRQSLCMLFVLNRSPYLEDLSEAFLASIPSEGRTKRKGKIILGLQHLGILPPPSKQPIVATIPLDREGMDQEWHSWCLAWFHQAVDLTPTIRTHYMYHLFSVGRWLSTQFPDIRTPEQWTEELALHFRSDLCSWTQGQYGGREGQRRLRTKGTLGQPLQAAGLVPYLVAVKHFFSALIRLPHAIGNAPARRIRLNFNPQEIFTAPNHIKKALEAASPRDIDLHIWAKLTIAAATLAQSDLPANTLYSLTFYRALALVWVTSARRPNEIARLRLDCLREDWEPSMLNEDGVPVENVIDRQEHQGSDQEEIENKPPKIYYLQIPAGKSRGAFWIWIPDYVAEAINAWKRERPPQQRKFLDRKDREEVDFLFCYRERHSGVPFINNSVIPILCKRAGVSIEDAKGKITGHRGRSTRLTLLQRNGVSLNDLAEYAGHANTRTIRRYVRHNPLQLHRTIQAADDVSRMIEGVIDMQAAAQGLPALRWFIGYDANGDPMFCGNQSYITCPHRLDCSRRLLRFARA